MHGCLLIQHVTRHIIRHFPERTNSAFPPPSPSIQCTRTQCTKNSCGGGGKQLDKLYLDKQICLAAVWEILGPPEEKEEIYTRVQWICQRHSQSHLSFYTPPFSIFFPNDIKKEWSKVAGGWFNLSNNTIRRMLLSSITDFIDDRIIPVSFFFFFFFFFFFLFLLYPSGIASSTQLRHTLSFLSLSFFLCSNRT